MFMAAPPSIVNIVYIIYTQYIYY